MNIFVTGLTGAVGSYLADHLVHTNLEIYALVSKPEKLAPHVKTAKNIHLVLGTLETISDHKDIIYKCESILHIATNWVDRNDDDNSVNRKQTLEMLSYVNPKIVEKIIIFSTASVLGRGNQLLPEANKYGTGYIKSKYDLYVTLKDHPLHDKIITVFPTMVLSGDNTHQYSHIGEGLKTAKSFIKWARFISLEGSFHFIHADDIAKITLYLLSHDTDKSDYVLGNPATTLDSLVNETAKYFGYRVYFKIPIFIGFILFLAKLLGKKIEPYSQFCMEYKHFVYDVVDAKSFGLKSNYDTWTKVLASIESH